MYFSSVIDFTTEDIPVDPVVTGDSGVGNDSNERDGDNADGGGHVGRGDILLAQHKL